MFTQIGSGGFVDKDIYMIVSPGWSSMFKGNVGQCLVRAKPVRKRSFPGFPGWRGWATLGLPTGSFLTFQCHFVSDNCSDNISFHWKPLLGFESSPLHLSEGFLSDGWTDQHLYTIKSVLSSIVIILIDILLTNMNTSITSINISIARNILAG